MSSRPRRSIVRPDYRSLANISVPRPSYCTSRGKENSSDSDKLYRLTVVEDEANGMVKVHYIGYSHEYDEWRSNEDIVELNVEDESSFDEQDSHDESNTIPAAPFSTNHQSLEQRWLHHLGFEVITPRRGIYYDGHEREDVVEYRKEYLRKMVKIGFIHFTNAPTESAKLAIPTDIDPPTLEKRSKTVVFFHDESTFNANDDQNLKWGVKGEKIIKPKSKGAGIMISDFVDEHQGFLALTDGEHQLAKQSDPEIKQYAREFLEYGESREGYWTRDKFIAQMERAIKIAEIKYPKTQGWRHVWVFDHSSCHAAMGDDALEVAHMNVKPGGKQRIMRDTTYDGKVQKMYYTVRGEKIAKGMKMVLEERGISTIGKNAGWMRETLAAHPDFRDEKCLVAHLLVNKGHIPVFLPKFHPELNPIERVWAHLKRYTRAHCYYSLQSLRKNIPLSYDSVTLENIQNHFRKVKHYMFGYLEGFAPGKDFEDTLKKYKVAVKSHRRIGVNE